MGGWGWVGGWGGEGGGRGSKAAFCSEIFFFPHKWGGVDFLAQKRHGGHCSEPFQKGTSSPDSENGEFVTQQRIESAVPLCSETKSGDGDSDVGPGYCGTSEDCRRNGRQVLGDGLSVQLGAILPVSSRGAGGAVISIEHEVVFSTTLCSVFEFLCSSLCSSGPFLAPEKGNSPRSAGIAQKKKIAASGTRRGSVLCLLVCAPVRVPVAMRAACAGAAGRRLPLLLKVDMSAGHFSASDRWRPRRPRTRPAAVLKHARTPADTSTQEEQASPVLAGAGGRSCPRRQT